MTVLLSIELHILLIALALAYALLGVFLTWVAYDNLQSIVTVKQF